MRREAIAVVALALLTGASSCGQPPLPRVSSDVVPGCDAPGGAGALVKAVVTLDAQDNACVARLEPAKVCVVPGGAIRFSIVNNCGALIDPSRPALQLIQPRPKPEPNPPPGKKEWSLRTCNFDRIGQGPANPSVHHCDLPGEKEIADGLYKYGFTGQIRTLDPDVEVRRGH